MGRVGLEVVGWVVWPVGRDGSGCLGPVGWGGSGWVVGRFDRDGLSSGWKWEWVDG